MSNISDQSGDERERRIAELKKKMQEAAAKNKAKQDAAEEIGADDSASVESTVAAESVDVQPENVGALETETNTEEISESVVADATDDVSEDSVATATANDSGAESSAQMSDEAEAVVASTFAYMPKEKTEEEKLRTQMNRREFLTYTWGAAMGLLLLGSGVATFQFMYPRFKAGEFGGAFLMGPDTALPPTDASPQPVTDGKFWWINTEVEGPQALYMVCTHLGCLYKWVEERYRFECPCHGSKFTRDGLYIEGPAPRSLDHFVTEQIDGVWVVDTGAKINGEPAALSPAAGTG